MEISFEEIKSIAKNNNLPILSNVKFVHGQYILESFKDEKNLMAIFSKPYLEKDEYNKNFIRLLKSIEWSLKNSKRQYGSKEVARQMGGVGEINNYDDYEIRILRAEHDKTIVPSIGKTGYYILIELTIGRVK